MKKKKENKNLTKWLTKGFLGGGAYGITALIIHTVVSGVASLIGITIVPLSTDTVGPLTESFTLFILAPFVAGLIYSLAYYAIKPTLPGKTLEKGLVYGFMLWILISIQSLFLTGSSGDISQIAIVTWLFLTLAQLTAGSVAISYVHE